MRVQIRRRNIPEEELLADLRRVVESHDIARLTRKTYDRHGRFNSSAFCKRFGSWAHACELAGIPTGASPSRGQDDNAWMSNIYDTWVALGRQPTYDDMARSPSRFGPTGYARRFGSWSIALEMFQTWIDDQDESGVPAPQAATPARGTRVAPRAPNLRMRWQVLERDRFTCLGCGRSPATAPGTVLHVDHVLPWSKGGQTEVENLQTLCDRCNQGKGDRAPQSGSPAV